MVAILGFRSTLKLITLGGDPVKKKCANIGVDPCNSFSEVENVSINDSQEWPS